MLRCRIDVRDLGRARWRWQSGQLTSGTSWIQPIAHPMVDVLCSELPDLVRLIMRDRPQPDHGTDPTIRSGYHVEIIVSPGSLRVTAGTGGTAPLYLTMVDHVVEGSWHLPDLRGHAQVDCLLDRAIARGLTRHLRYSSDTVFDGLVMLTERATATATVSSNGIAVAYPEPAEHVLVTRRPRLGTDVVRAFDGLLAAAVDRALLDGLRIGVELSGGVDSANVALTAARRGAVTCFGLLLDGIGDGYQDSSQQRRRHAVTSLLRLPDVTIDAVDHPPFAPAGVRGRGAAHDPSSAFYREAFDALRDAAGGRVDVMLTGLGGDELLATPSPVAVNGPDPVSWLGKRALAALDTIDDNLAPVSVLPVPALMSFALHNPAYLQADLWPTAPLTDPTLVRFGEQLPMAWRRNKALLRERLRRAGFPRQVSHPDRPESFSPLMQLGLRRHGLRLVRHMLRESVLVDTGHVDHHRFATAYEAALRSPVIPSRLCDTIALEVGIRSLISRPFPSPPTPEGPRTP